MELTFVIIGWDDASQDEQHHFLNEDLTPVSSISVGYLVNETSDHITIARDYFPEDKVVRCRECIPKTCITFVERITKVLEEKK